MKKVLIATLSFILISSLIFTIFLILIIINYTTLWSCLLPNDYYFYRMHKIIARGEMGWDDDIEDIFHFLQNCTDDKQRLAQKLLADRDGTIVSLGMDLIILESLSNGGKTLSQYQDDSRWNFNMATNKEYSKFLLVLWKIKNNISVTDQDKDVLKGWSEEYFTRLKVAKPNF